MMNDDMLTNIDYIREKANVSYEEAAELLERYDGNVMRVLVELEHQGKVYAQPAADQSRDAYQQRQSNASDAKDKAASFINNAFKNRLVIERKRDDGEKELVANVSVPVALGVTVFAPYLTAAVAGVGFLTGHSVKIRKEKTERQDT